MAFIGLLLLLVNPLFIKSGTAYWWLPQFWLPIVLWLPWSIIIDYISLLKTRLILRFLTRSEVRSLAVGILGIDYALYRMLFALGSLTAVGLALYLTGDLLFFTSEYIDKWTQWNFAQSPTLLVYPIYLREDPVSVIFFWSGLAPSVWMWLYVLALFATRGLLRSEKLVTWLRWFLDIEKNPFRSIGAVAAALAFIASVAIILVSAEVSRITAAS